MIQQLAQLYLLLLAMNFMGKYRSLTDFAPDVAAINQWREQLRLFVALPTLKDAPQICPDAYRVNTQMSRVRLAPLSRWHNYMAACGVFLLLLSVVNWVWASWPVIDFLREYGGGG